MDSAEIVPARRKILIACRKLVPDSSHESAVFCGGEQRIASEIAVHLGQHQWRVYFASDDPSSVQNVRYLDAHGVTHIRVPFHRRTRLASSVLHLLRCITAQSIDLVHCHDRRTVVAGAIACKLAGIPLVYTAHSVFYDKLLTRLFLGRHVVAISETVQRNLEQEFQRPPGSVRLIYNGVDVHRSSAEERSRLRQELGLRREDRVISVIDRLVAQKGHQLLLEAMPRIIPAFPDLRVLLVGDGPLRRELEDLTHRLGLDAHVVFCGTRPNATQFMELSEFTVAPSVREGFHLAVVESLSLGVPVVASAIACHREILAHDDMGLLVPSDQPAALAEAILFMLRNRQQVHCMGRRCSHIAKRDFGLPQMLTRYEEYYEELLHPTAPAG
jgi:glycosyltransferase involved in cell wall biosynthesis